MNIGEKKEMYCPDCQEYTMHEFVSEIQEASVGGKTITGTVVYWKCPQCEDGYNVDSSDFDWKYTVALREYRNNMLTGSQIKAIREEKKMTVNKFVEYLNENGITYSVDEYNEIENDTLAQSGTLENFMRKIGGLPEWKGYRK